MPGINGIEVAQKVRKKNTEAVIVFIAHLVDEIERSFIVL